MSPLRFNHSDNFNPLPRKEGDGAMLLLETRSEKISIHSLVKRETVLPIGQQNLKALISIHSLVKRETLVEFCSFLSILISIHSLVKRETPRPLFSPPL